MWPTSRNVSATSAYFPEEDCQATRPMKINPFKWSIRLAQSGSISQSNKQTAARPREIGEERQHGPPPQPLRHNHLAVDVNAVNLKHRLRQIETDECRGHRAISLMRATYPSCGTTWPDAEPVHPITLTPKPPYHFNPTTFFSASS